MKSGQSKYGYGKSKEKVLLGFSQGLTVCEIAKANKMSYASVYSVVRKNGLVMKATNRKKHGAVKAIVLAEHELGLTPPQIITKHNLNRESVYAVYYYCNIKPLKLIKK